MSAISVELIIKSVTLNRKDVFVITPIVSIFKNLTPLNSIPPFSLFTKKVTLILTWVAVNLILRNDDLAGVGIISVFDGVAEDADYTDHLASLTDAVRDIAGVTDELLTTRHLQKEWINAALWRAWCCHVEYKSVNKLTLCPLWCLLWHTDIHRFA